MDRRELVLAALAPAKGKPHSPVQVQKMFFLIDKGISQLVGGPHFDFEPYNYGPFDSDVYNELENLAREGHLEFVQQRRWVNYRLTDLGQQLGDVQLNSLPPKAKNYIEELSEFVRSLSFTQLVSAIYKAFPEMRKHSVFQG